MTLAKITKVVARAVLAPLERPITTATVSIPQAPLVLIDIQTDQGIVGHSYVFTYTPIALGPMIGLVEDMGASLIGKSLHPISRMAEMEQQIRLLGRQGLVAMALAGLDMSLWDAHAKSLNCTVVEVLGAAARPIPCYDSLGVFAIGRDEPLLEKSIGMGFKAIKIKVGGGTLAQDVTVLNAVRGQIGPDIRLMIDYNQTLTVPEAVTRIRRFEDEGFQLDWVEEPVEAEDFVGHSAVRKSVKTAIQSGENWWMPDDAARAIQAGISDHAMLDVMKIGGITGWQRAASYARAASLPVSSHLFIEASAHALCATPNAHLLEYLDVAGALLEAPHHVEDGSLTPRGPGLGIGWNESAVQRALI
ncbi:enolase C-terminal domain-like protein [uncultured Hoeflea sp.]|uniref:enolase C-terminal domain-like protein n=1 Tax=uncultured Hoeflea sp. TaxID=538666 RepID=UPI0026269A30|nr:enolase C-terminal domain-like protein [uncultured Hoeflea sp.]